MLYNGAGQPRESGLGRSAVTVTSGLGFLPEMWARTCAGVSIPRSAGVLVIDVVLVFALLTAGRRPTTRFLARMNGDGDEVVLAE